VPLVPTLCRRSACASAAASLARIEGRVAFPGCAIAGCEEDGGRIDDVGAVGARMAACDSRGEGA